MLACKKKEDKRNWQALKLRGMDAQPESPILNKDEVLSTRMQTFQELAAVLLEIWKEMVTVRVLWKRSWSCGRRS